MDVTSHTRGRIAKALVSLCLEQEVADDIAFHMTDWKSNLDELLEIYNRPDEFSDEQIQKVIIKFLAHVPNHIAAAKKLIGLGPVEDIFNAGVLKEDD